MSGLFGVLGAVEASVVSAATERLSHRGRRQLTLRVSDEIVLAAVAEEPEGCLAVQEDLAIVCTARLSSARKVLATLPGAPPAATPAEVLLSLYRQCGVEGLRGIEGEFAFALVDRGRRELILGRDFFGFSPLYYTVSASETIAFASEYKALLALPGCEPIIDRDMVQYLQCAKKVPVGRTLLKNIRAAPPGTLIRLDHSGPATELHVSAPLEVEPTLVSEEEASGALARQLTEAVERQSNDLEPVGLALSGGIDSIGLAFLLRRMYPGREIHTFSAGSTVNDHELSTAARVAGLIGSIHHQVVTPPSLLERTLRPVVWHLEEPVARSEVPQLFEIGRAASGHVGTLLSGQGADSLFGGMPRYKLLALMNRLPLLRQPLHEFYSLTQYGRKPEGFMARSLDKAYFRGRVPDVPRVSGSTYRPPPGSLPTLGPEFVNRAMAAGFQAGQCQDAQKYERCFAAWGLRYRSPFSDLSFARFAFTISDCLKIHRGVQKYILRQALTSIVPEEFRNIPKFPQRMRCDLEFSAVLDELAARLLNDHALEARGLFRHAEVERLRRRPAGKAYFNEGAMRLWTLILTELWAQEFVDKRGTG